MKATILLPGLSVEIEGGDIKETFQKVAEINEVFGDSHCGLCGGEAAPRFRQSGQFKYFEIQCRDHNCGAHLEMGQPTAGGIYPKRRLLPSGKPESGKPTDPAGEYGPHNGWTKYRGDNGETAAITPAASALPATITQQQLRDLLDLSAKAGADMVALLKHYGIDGLKALPASQFVDCMQKLEKKREANAKR